MPRMFTWVSPTSAAFTRVTPGVSAIKSSTRSMPASSMAAVPIAVTDPGTSCTLSDRLRAVTTISSVIVVAVCAVVVLGATTPTAPVIASTTGNDALIRYISNP